MAERHLHYASCAALRVSMDTLQFWTSKQNKNNLFFKFINNLLSQKNNLIIFNNKIDHHKKIISIDKKCMIGLKII